MTLHMQEASDWKTILADFHSICLTSAILFFYKSKEEYTLIRFDPYCLDIPSIDIKSTLL